MNFQYLISTRRTKLFHKVFYTSYSDFTLIAKRIVRKNLTISIVSNNYFKSEISFRLTPIINRSFFILFHTDRYIFFHKSSTYQMRNIFCFFVIFFMVISRLRASLFVSNSSWYSNFTGSLPRVYLAHFHSLCVLSLFSTLSVYPV